MNITDIRVKLIDQPERGRLRAFCSVSFDHMFVVNDIKVIQGDERLFMAMPSRPITIRCEHCQQKNALAWKRNDCICCHAPLPERTVPLSEGRSQPFLDVCHPLNSTVRSWLEDKVLTAYRQVLQQELDLALVED